MEVDQSCGIHLILGPMFSGKTSELFRLCNRHILSGKKVVIVKYDKDMRYDNEMASTHDLKKMPAISTNLIENVYDKLLQFDVIGIDEGQFYPDIFKYTECLANQGKHVFIAALDGNYARQPFCNISPLISVAESVRKLTAVCHKCGNSAAFTFRTTMDTQVELIGGHGMYMAVCRRCYHFLTTAKKEMLCNNNS